MFSIKLIVKDNIFEENQLHYLYIVETFLISY